PPPRGGGAPGRPGPPGRFEGLVGLGPPGRGRGGNGRRGTGRIDRSNGGPGAPRTGVAEGGGGGGARLGAVDEGGYVDVEGARRHGRRERAAHARPPPLSNRLVLVRA